MTIFTSLTGWREAVAPGTLLLGEQLALIVEILPAEQFAPDSPGRLHIDKRIFHLGGGRQHDGRPAEDGHHRLARHRSLPVPCSWWWRTASVRQKTIPAATEFRSSGPRLAFVHRLVWIRRSRLTCC
jgi:hypothetical protein